MPANDDWIARTAASVIAEGERRHPGRPPTCASGISPSGSVHLGNLRELMTPHLVADEVRRGGHPCRHILSWDDYDRFRRVPAGIPESFAEFIGRPLTSVPDPVGDGCHPNWAEHFKDPLREALARLGVRVTEISQTQMYTSGAYTDRIILAMRRRAEIGAVLRRYQTKRKGQQEIAVAEGPGQFNTVAEGPGQFDTDDEDAAPRPEARANPTPRPEAQANPALQAEYFPFRPYCADCGRDDATVTSFDDDTTEVSYVCGCGATHGPTPIAEVAGKLAWKVDWPMRWAYEGVTFEPAGVDHASPGSSFTVGEHLVKEIFGGEMPLHFGYSFVGTPGAAKISSSSGGAPTPKDALEIFEAPLLRWLYARRRPEQSITLAFNAEVWRTYDEWDALARKVKDGTAEPASVASYTRASTTAEEELAKTPVPVQFRALTSIVDITAGDEEQELRILRAMTPQDPIASLDQVRPRLDCAAAWVAGYMPEDARTEVRDEPDLALLATLTEQDRHALKLLTGEMGQHWTLDELTTLLYGVPKLIRGLPLTAPPTPELKEAQRTWFILLYRLLISKDTGPRLPTLLLALGQDKVRQLLAG